MTADLLRKDFHQTSSQVEKRNLILDVAMEEFAKKSFSDTNISDISSKLKISDATIYQYFENKEDLLFAIPEKKMKEANEQLELHLLGIRGDDNKLRKFIWFYFWFFENNQDWANIVILILRTSRRFLKAKGYNLVQEFAKILLRIIEDGKREGFFRPEIDAYVVRSLILGVIEHLAQFWLLKEKPSGFLLERVDMVSDLILRALRNKTE